MFCRSITMTAADEVSSKPSRSSISAPTTSSTPSAPKVQARTFGPGISTIRARSGARARMRRRRAMLDSISLWANERRKTSTPAATRPRTTSSESEAGPTVATIFVRRTGIPFNASSESKRMTRANHAEWERRRHDRLLPPRAGPCRSNHRVRVSAAPRSLDRAEPRVRRESPPSRRRIGPPDSSRGG